MIRIILFLKSLNSERTSTLRLGKRWILMISLIQTLTFLSEKSFSYSARCSDNYYRLMGSSVALPARVLSCFTNPVLTDFFLVGHFSSIVLAWILLNYSFPMILVGFFGINLYYKSHWFQDGGTNLLNLAVLFLIFTGDLSFSKKKSVFLNNLSLGAIRLQVALMYFVALTSKIQGTYWREGTALLYIFQSDYFGLPSVRNVLISYPLLSLIVGRRAPCDALPP
jgi:hypothetical protein